MNRATEDVNVLNDLALGLVGQVDELSSPDIETIYNTSMTLAYLAMVACQKSDLALVVKTLNPALIPEETLALLQSKLHGGRKQ